MSVKGIEDVLGDKTKLRIISFLLSSGSANITRIVEEARSNYARVKRHLDELESMGIVRQERLGRLRVYHINREHPVVKALEKLQRLGAGDESGLQAENG